MIHLRRVIRFLVLTTALGLALVEQAAGQPAALDAGGSDLDLYIVRHAQTLANVTKNYSQANQMAFSEQGHREIAELMGKLENRRFDQVLVSPTWRTQHTIAPFLAQRDAVGEIWPELEECCYHTNRSAPVSDPRPRGGRISIDSDVAERFIYRDGTASHWYNAKNYADSEQQVGEATDLLRLRFGGSRKSILIVSHFHTGAWMIADLVGDRAAHKIALQTGKLTHLRQQPDGRFRIVSLNEERFTGEY